jgi:hypothetical protein
VLESQKLLTYYIYKGALFTLARSESDSSEEYSYGKSINLHGCSFKYVGYIVAKA